MDPTAIFNPVLKAKAMDEIDTMAQFVGNMVGPGEAIQNLAEASSAEDFDTPKGRGRFVGALARLGFELSPVDEFTAAAKLIGVGGVGVYSMLKGSALRKLWDDAPKEVIANLGEEAVEDVAILYDLFPQKIFDALDDINYVSGTSYGGRVTGGHLQAIPRRNLEIEINYDIPFDGTPPGTEAYRAAVHEAGHLMHFTMDPRRQFSERQYADLMNINDGFLPTKSIDTPQKLSQWMADFNDTVRETLKDKYNLGELDRAEVKTIWDQYYYGPSPVEEIARSVETAFKNKEPHFLKQEDLYTVMSDKMVALLGELKTPKGPMITPEEMIDKLNVFDLKIIDPNAPKGWGSTD